MFRACAPDPVQGLICFTCVTIQDKTKCQGFSSVMIGSQVYTMLTGDHVVDLPLNIFVFWMYSPVITSNRPYPLQIQCYKYRSLAF